MCNGRIFDMSDALDSLPGDAIQHLFGLFSQSVVRRWISSDDTQCTFMCISHLFCWDQICTEPKIFACRACERNGAAKLPAQLSPPFTGLSLTASFPFQRPPTRLPLHSCSDAHALDFLTPHSRLHSAHWDFWPAPLRSRAGFKWRGRGLQVPAKSPRQQRASSSH